jgi:3-oxoadipate enol-lactonase
MSSLELAYRLPEDFDPKGRVVLLGSSLGSASLMWARALSFLAPEMQTVTWDLPGHGDSAPAERAFSLADIAEAVVDLADKLGVETFDYAGVSISGAIALELALAHPERLRSIAVMFSAAKLGTPESWADRAALVRASGTSTLLPDMPPRWFSPQFVLEDPMWLDTMLEVLSDVDDDSYAKCCEALGAYDVRDRLSEVKVPSLVIAGDHDPSISADQIRELMTGLPDPKLFVVEGGRHLAVVDFPALTAGALNTFWSTIH